MNHRTFIKTLTSDQRQRLTQRSNRHAIIRLIVLVLCFVMTSSAIVIKLPFLGFWLIAQGLLLVSLFHLMHECVHDTVFEKRLPNRILAHACGFIIFIPAIWFRHFHHAHHRYTQQIEKDPELLSAKPQNGWQWLIHITGLNIWRSQLGLLVSALIKPVQEPYLKENKQMFARLEMLLMLGAYTLLAVISVLTKNSVLLFLWIIPIVIGQPFLRLYLLAEHTGCDNESNMLQNTRTVLTNPIVRWFTWNMPYHTEHHVYPSVPFHQLPALHELMRLYSSVTDPGYVHFNVEYLKQVTMSGRSR